MVPASTTRLLDVGCGAGVMASWAKKSLGIQEVYGIELFQEAADKARSLLDGLIVGDIEQTELPWTGFDCIVCGDVIEHLKDPWMAVRKLSTHLNPNGVLIASIPNVAHFSVISKLLRDKFEYQDAGILDRTHLRFFTKHTISKLFLCCGLEIKVWDTIEARTWKHEVFHAITLGVLKHCSVKQYLVMASLPSRASSQSYQG